VEDWIGDAGGHDAALASLRIEAGPEDEMISLTEVNDSIARTVRQQIHAPADRIVRWLLVNWWRLRWEPRRETREWRMAHSMAAIGEGYAWPPLEFSSDGPFMQVRMEAESSPDVAAIRYLRSANLEIPAGEFEKAVDEFTALVMERLAALGSPDPDIQELWSELQEERATPALYRDCRSQALAGINPGEAPEAWIRQVNELGERSGQIALDEVLAVSPRLNHDLSVASEQIEAMRKSECAIDLSWIELPARSPLGELPWQQGARLASQFRKTANLPEGPILDKDIEDRLGVRLPLAASGSRQILGGGYRNGRPDRRTTVFVHTPRIDNQRFLLARLIGCAMILPLQEHFLPVTDALTALQKIERSFAQELLCPWADLDAFTDESGLEEEGISAAAERFGVSERLVVTTLVNKRKLPRGRLESV
jgi:hypothetical protein